MVGDRSYPQCEWAFSRILPNCFHLYGTKIQCQHPQKELAIVSFSCRNVKPSVNDIQDICKHCDVLLLQETWLADFELTVLANIHGNFYDKEISYIDSTNYLNVGRPHRRLALLLYKELANHSSIFDMKDDRIIGIEIQKAKEKIVILNMYIPYCIDDNFDDFCYYLVKLDDLIKDFTTPYINIIGKEL